MKIEQLRYVIKKRFDFTHGNKINALIRDIFKLIKRDEKRNEVSLWI
jgi:hypothetical protein